MILLRIFSFLILLLAGVFTPLWLVVPCIIAYTFVFGGYEVLVLAALIDGYFGAGITWPYYTAIALVVAVIAEWVRPSLTLFRNG